MGDRDHHIDGLSQKQYRLWKLAVDKSNSELWKDQHETDAGARVITPFEQGRGSSLKRP